MEKNRPTFEEAKAKYVHRFTMEHVPAWAADEFYPKGTPRFYAPQYKTDREWYDKTVFPTDKRTRHCFSAGQSWPIGHSLSKPFTKR